MSTKQEIALEFDTPQKVFVYGSLREKLPNHHYMNLENQGNTRIMSDSPDGLFEIEGFDMYPITESYPWPYPFCVESEGHVIKAELYEVSPITMYYLNMLESYDPIAPETSMYDRMEVTSKDGQKGLMYFMRHETAFGKHGYMGKKKIDPIVSGDWLDFVKTSYATHIAKATAYLEYLES